MSNVAVRKILCLVRILCMSNVPPKRGGCRTATVEFEGIHQILEVVVELCRRLRNPETQRGSKICVHKTILTIRQLRLVDTIDSELEPEESGHHKRNSKNQKHMFTKEMPKDRESLLAAWEAINPSQKLPYEVQGLLIAYFRHAELHGECTVRMFAPSEQQSEQFTSSPSRFVRQPRANKKKAPPQSAETATCSNSEEVSTCKRKQEQPSPAENPIRITASRCGINLIANGLREKDFH